LIAGLQGGPGVAYKFATVIASWCFDAPAKGSMLPSTPLASALTVGKALPAAGSSRESVGAQHRALLSVQ